MNRREFLSALSGGLLAPPFAAEGQPAEKIYRIGVLAGVPTPPVQDAFLQGLRERGYEEGRNLALDWRWSMGQPGRFPELAAELVRLKVDLIVVVTNESARAAKQATATIPIVIGSSSTPDRAGLVTSLARPGGNVTGLTIDTGSEMASKMLQLLKESAPRASRVAVLLEANPLVTFHPWADQSGRLARDIEAAGHGLRLTLQPVRVQAASELADVFTAIISTRADALLVDTASGLAFAHRRTIVEFAAKHRLPAIYAFRQFPEDGGLMAYGVDLRDLYRRAAGYADKIFKGAKPGDLPMEQPTKFEFVVNLKTAKALGLTIPPSLLQRADQVIE